MSTLTSLNVVFMISVTGVYTTPTQLQGFAADGGFEQESADRVETVLGADGKMSYGLIARQYAQTVTLQPDSASNIIFENWDLAQTTLGDVITANASIVYPGLSRKYTLSNGVMKGFKPLPDLGKLLKPRTFALIWNTITPAAM